MTSAFCYFFLLFPHIFILIINIKIKNKYYIKLKLQLQFKKTTMMFYYTLRHKCTIHKHYYTWFIMHQNNIVLNLLSMKYCNFLKVLSDF
jgi:hypothetical protein